jgi:hypothetical protein
LNARAAKVAEAADADVLGYIGPMANPADDEIKDAIEAIGPKRGALLVLIETSGGYITVVERIAQILRHHYKRVVFGVPTFAMSAGTVLVMSGDAILMDYASTLGPIDPQVMVKGHRFVPALGYLEQYERLIKKSAVGTLTTAELAYLIQNFDPAELYRYEQERELSIALLETWLATYKFKNWKRTESSDLRVTPKMRADRARDIATKLNDVSLWHSHGRGIPMEVLRRDLKLQIDDIGESPDLATRIHDYFRLLQDYQIHRSHSMFVIHTEGRHVGY